MSKAAAPAPQALVNADIATNAPANAAVVLSAFGALFGPQEMVSLMAAVEALVAKVQNGDMSVVEQMLLSQSVALQGVFTSLTYRAATQTNPRLLQTQLGLALRAQSQARATLETLIQLKQPSAATYIGQANIAAQQQVNNGVALAPGAADQPGFDQNRLMEALDEQRLVLGAASASGRNDPVLATLDAFNGAENSCGQEPHKDECHPARPYLTRGATGATAIEQAAAPVRTIAGGHQIVG